MKKTWLKRALCGMLAGVMVLSAAACSGGGSDAPPAGGTQSGNAPAGGAPAASGDQKVIKFMHRFPDEPYNSFIESKLHDLTRILSLRLLALRIRNIRKRSRLL